MTKDKDTKTVVPALRFPEFRDGEGWHNVRLIDVTDKRIKWHFTGGPFGSNLKASDYTNSGIRVIQLQNIGDGYFVEDYKIYTSIEKSDELLGCNIYPGNIIMSKMGDPVGRACLIPDNEDRYLMCSDGIKLVIDEDKNDKYFIIKAINAEEFRRKIERSATGSTRKRISLDTLRDLTLLISNNKVEQKKIAECLGSLDDLISAVADKIETLKEYKKGLMQQLFPAEGKTIPAIRFPEFRNAPDWQEMSLRDIGEIITGSTPCTKDSNNYGGEKLFVSPADITDKRYVSQTKTTLSEKGFRLSRRIKENSILFVCIGSTIGKVAQNTRECATNQQINSIMPYKGHVADFVYSILEHYAPQIASIAGNQAVPIINKTLFSSVSLLMPKEEEQKKIADCLLSVDELISTEIDKLDQLKAHKKGLMQQLFPKLQ
ncbi:restriction endonuclease subunit S [Parabacteroides johnsonii]|nr:restriction endonuclease subunit S [uncultured Parabacteroides sp.]